MQSGVEIFERQLCDVHNQYPELAIYRNLNEPYLQGSIDLQTDSGESLSSYFVKITHKDGFPNCFPNLYEVGGDIPSSADWHKYSDGSCCVTAPLIEKLACIRGITILEFIKSFAIPYLANQYHRKVFGHYKDEYSHGEVGILQSYKDVMQCDKIDMWIEYLDYALLRSEPNIRRNALCHCGSEKKYKNCHKLVLDNLRRLDREDLLNIKNHIKLCVLRKECL